MSMLLAFAARAGRHCWLQNAIPQVSNRAVHYREAYARCIGSQRWMASLPEHQVLGMPALSPTMTNGNLAKWHVKEGDEVAPGALLADVETDKAVVAFETQDSGFIAKLLVAEGASNLPVGAPLLVMTEESKDVAAFKDFAPGKQGGDGQTASKATGTSSSTSQQKGEEKAAKTVTERLPTNLRIGPAARLLLEEAGLSKEEVTPSGPNGIITKGDVLEAMSHEGAKRPQQQPEKQQAVTEQKQPQPPAQEQPAKAASKPASQEAAAKPSTPSPAAQPAGASFTDIPNSQIRKIIAQRLVESKTSIPSLYASADVSMDAVANMRRKLAASGTKVSVNDFVIKAVAMALREVPEANCLWDQKAFQATPAPGIDVSVAVATDRGLITPIVKAADTKSITQISQEIKELAAKAKANKLKPEEFQGGSFTVSNLGMYGVSYFSAIINPPQAAILAVGGSQQVVRLVGGQPTEESVMTVTLSADHRMYDGELLTKFLSSFKQKLESPVVLLLPANAE